MGAGLQNHPGNALFRRSVRRHDGTAQEHSLCPRAPPR
jgi:hypothetical protein